MHCLVLADHVALVEHIYAEAVSGMKSISKSDWNDPAIGGYLSLEIGAIKKPLHPNKICLQSARAALISVLNQSPFKAIYLPVYICETVVDAVKMAGVDILWYQLTNQLNIKEEVQLKPNECILLVNYFGLWTSAINKAVKNFKRSQIIVDCSQAVYAPPIPGVRATIYSPRKYFGVPDGGWLVSERKFDTPKCRDQDSINRANHLLVRIEEGAEAGYRAYQEAELSLANQPPKEMSRFTQRLLAAVDYQKVKEQRLRNFHYLLSRIDQAKLFMPYASSTDVPLCLPYRTTAANARAALQDLKIFIPTFWLDACSRLTAKQSEKWVRGLLPLPLDQRYSQREMDRLLNALESSKC